ncbi:MAG: tRNA lysidine(34) synthetase TilS [Clostridia bacterium]|nr:tRNA lysidine(34) synthetase TilS [Clostridia bacterium]
MITKVKNTLDLYGMIPRGASITVALSGGADSVSLLYALRELADEYGLTVSAAHVNHCLRGEESDRDEEFVKEICESLGVRLSLLRADVAGEAKASGEGVEECGRRIRYDFLEKCADGGLIATAHTLSDSVETLLFNISRGTSIHGLCGIPPVRGNIVRPLIECTRQDVEEYCAANNIAFVTDSTNNSDKYTRNRIRHRLVPELQKLNPSFWDAALRMIRGNIADDAYLLSVADEALSACTVKEGIDAEKLATYPRPIRLRALAKKAAEVCSKACESKHIEKMDSLLVPGGQTVIYGGVTARVRHGILEFVVGGAQVKWSVEVEGELTPIPMGYLSIEEQTHAKYDNSLKVHRKLAKQAIDSAKIQGRLTVRSRLEGDSVRLSGRGVTKTLKKLFNEAGIAPEKRLGTAVLADEEGVIWVDGFGCDERCEVDQDTQKVLLLNILSPEGK